MLSQYKQQPFPLFETQEKNLTHQGSGAITNDSNAIGFEDKAFHNWYRFVLSYPPHLVRDYIRDFCLDKNNVILDPFCGTGTTIVEAKLNHIRSVGIEANPLPLHKSLVLLEHLNRFQQSAAFKYGLLALGNALVTSIGNLRFGPEVGVGKIISPNSIDAVITSPPYPNEKDYTRATRLESVILGFFTDMAHLRTYKKELLRSNTRGVYKVDDDDKWIENHHKIQKLADQIENRRIELGKTSGFEKLYARVTKLYFGGMARHLTELTAVLKPGVQLAYVMGDQASYLRVLIQTGELLAEIASDIGYEVKRIDLFRTRFSTATQAELREEVVVMRWTGDKRAARGIIT